MAKNTTAVGLRAENIAADYMRAHGYKLIVRNDRTRFAELDLVMADREYIVFVEVKYRAHVNYGGGTGAITMDKLRRLRNAAETWLADHQEYGSLQPRIDVISVRGSLESPHIEHIENITD